MCLYMCVMVDQREALAVTTIIDNIIYIYPVSSQPTKKVGWPGIMLEGEFLD